MKVIARQHSRLTDPITLLTFDPILDVHTGTYVGAAEVPDEHLDRFRSDPQFEIYDEAAFHELTSPKSEPKQIDRSTGDPFPVRDLDNSKSDPNVVKLDIAKK